MNQRALIVLAVMAGIAAGISVSRWRSRVDGSAISEKVAAMPSATSVIRPAVRFEALPVPQPTSPPHLDPFNTVNAPMIQRSLERRRNRAIPSELAMGELLGMRGQLADLAQWRERAGRAGKAPDAMRRTPIRVLAQSQAFYKILAYAKNTNIESMEKKRQYTAALDFAWQDYVKSLSEIKNALKANRSAAGPEAEKQSAAIALKLGPQYAPETATGAPHATLVGSQYACEITLAMMGEVHDGAYITGIINSMKSLDHPELAAIYNEVAENAYFKGWGPDDLGLFNRGLVADTLDRVMSAQLTIEGENYKTWRAGLGLPEREQITLRKPDGPLLVNAAASRGGRGGTPPTIPLPEQLTYALPYTWGGDGLASMNDEQAKKIIQYAETMAEQIRARGTTMTNK